MSALPTDAFVPLSAAAVSAGATPDFRVLVVQHPDGLKPFRPASAIAAAPSSAPAAGPGCEPSVSLLRDGDHVTAIRVQCSCGQTIELACVYQAPAS